MKIQSKSGLRSTCSLLFVVGIAAVGLSQSPADPLADARSLLSAGKLAESEQALRSRLVMSPSSADAHFLLGYVLFRERRAKESLEECTAGAKIRQPHADELRVVASDYVMLGDFGDADKWFSQVVAEDPKDAESWYLLGRTKYNENEFAASISDFERALELRPRYVEAENNIGLAWKELNDSSKAKAAFQNAIDWQGATPDDAQPFLNLGTLLTDAGAHAEALPHLDRAVALSPANPTVREERGKVYLALGRLKDAQAEFEQAIATAPEISSLHYKLAQVYRKEGLLDRAKQEFDICQKLNSTHSSSKTPNPLSLNAPEQK